MAPIVDKHKEDSYRGMFSDVGGKLLQRGRDDWQLLRLVHTADADKTELSCRRCEQAIN